MCSAAPKGCSNVGPLSDRFLMYAQCLDILAQGNSPVKHTMGLHVLKRATHASGSLLGEVFPMDQLWSYVHIVPHFGRKADNQLSLTNCVHSSQLFFLNKYFNKDFFYAIN